MKMKPFDAEANCPKCAHDKVSTTYCGERNNYCPGKPDSTSYCPGDHLVRRCDRCHFGWAEACTAYRQVPVRVYREAVGRWKDTAVQIAADHVDALERIDAAIAILRRREWIYNGRSCPECFRDQDCGHEEGCMIGRVLSALAPRECSEVTA